MNTAKRVLKNTGYLTIGQIFTLGLGMVWMALFSRYVGPEGLGKYAFAQSTIAIVALFIEVGLQNLVIRNVSRNKQEGNLYFINTIFIKTFLSIIIYSVFLLIIIFSGWGRTNLQILIAFIFYSYINSITFAIIAIFYAYEEMKYDAMGQIVNGVLTFIGVLIGIKLRMSLVEIIYLSAFASTARLILNIFQIFKIKKFIINFNIRLIKYEIIKKMLIASLPFAVLSLIGVIYGNIIIVFLRNYTNDQQVGIFSAAQKMNSFLFIIPQMFMSAVFPSFSSIYKESKERMAKIFKLAYRVVIIYSFPFAVFIILYAKTIILIIYGKKYLESIVPFQILGLIILNSVGFVTGPALNAIGKERYFTKIFGITLILTTILSFLFIPSYGEISACFILLAGHIFGLIIYSLKIFQWLGIKYPNRTIIKTILISLLLALTILGIGFITDLVAAQIIVSLIILAGLFYLIKPFETEDVILLQQILPPKFGRYNKYLIKYIVRNAA